MERSDFFRTSPPSPLVWPRMHDHHAAELPTGQERALGALGIGDFHLPPNFHATGHTHDQPHLSFIVSGGLSERVDGSGRRTLSVADMRFSPAGDSHDIVAGPAGARCLVVEFDREWTDSASLRLPDSRRYSDDPALSLLARRMGVEAFSDSPSRLSVEGLGLELLAAVGRLERPRAELGAPAWLERVRDLLHDRCTESPGLDELSREAGVHPMHMTRAFRAHFGCSVGDYALRLRLDRAREMLLRTDLAIASVAVETGFADQSHLTRRMKRALGVTPHVLRRSHER